MVGDGVRRPSISASEELELLLARSAPLALVATDESWRIVGGNPALAELTGHDPADLVGDSFGSLLTVAARVLHQANLAPRLLADGHIDQVAVEIVRADGTRLPVLLSARLIDVGRTRTVIAFTPMSERHDHERELIAARRRAEHSERRAQRLHGIVRAFADVHGRCDVESLLATHLADLGFELGGLWLPDRERRGATASDGTPMPPPGPGVTRRTLGPTGAPLGYVDIRVAHAGSPSVEVAAADVLADEQTLASLFAATEQTLARLTLLDQLRRQASTDELTGLANRRYFDRVLASLLTERQRRDHPLTLFYLDLDGFKAVNDHQGHAAGDRLLCAVADDLSTSLRGYDVVARLGGDEFAVIVRDLVDRDEVDALATRLTGIVDREVGGRRVGGSVGAVHVPAGVDALDADRLLHAADVAMYEAKGQPLRDHVVHELA